MVGIATRLPSATVDRAGAEAWLANLPVTATAAPGARQRLTWACERLLDDFADDVERTGQTVALYALHVADILAEFGMDDEILCAALLHRLLSSGHLDEAAIEAQFGEQVLAMVASMVRIGRLVPGVLAAREKHKTDDPEKLRRMLLDISSDVRVLLILLAERVHLMRRLKHLPEDIQRRYSRNTLDIFAPLANRLGIWQVKWELEDLSLRFLEPDDYREIANQLDERRQERIDYIAAVKKILHDAFAHEGIAGDISGRPKHIYSIWRKMKRKDVDFRQVFDVRAVRVLVDSVADCYRALGVVHSLWRHIPGEFDDYIATPKANMYQSIHTVVIGPGDKPLEIQIRSQEMHEHAERGIAAHWRYKEQSGKESGLDQRIQRLRQWLEARAEGGASSVATRQADAEEESTLIYVLTPQGRVIELPYGATAVDFAYAVHTEVGHRCRGAKVDGRIVPLTQRLASGATVEILTAREGGPSRDWLRPGAGYVCSARARQSIRQWFKQQDYDKHLAAGRAMLEREAGRLERDRSGLEKAASRFSFRAVDDMLAAIGRGDLSAAQVAGVAEPRPAARPSQQVMEAPITEPQRRTRRRKPRKGGGRVRVQGIDDLMTTLAKCCKPVPEDPIVGYITRGRGVTVHRADCPVVTRLGVDERDRLVEVVWAEAEPDTVFSVDLMLVANDRKGLLRDISAVFSNEDVDVTNVKTQSDAKRQLALMKFSLMITGIGQLDQLIAKLLQVPDVTEVRRAV